MTPRSIPDSDHVIRYCRRRDVSKKSRLPTPRAFKPDDSVPRELSVNWCEFLDKPTCEEAVDVLRDTPGAMKPENRGCYAILNVGQAREVIAVVGNALPDVAHTPKPNNDSHADIRWQPSSNAEIEARIRTELAALAARSQLIPGLRGDPWRYDGAMQGG